MNARLATDCRTYGQGMLVPFGSVNPKLPDWQEDLRRCHEVHKMPGIRLHPNYHGYGLSDPAFTELLRLAAARDLIVQVVARMEDDRTQHPLMRVPPVNLAPLAAIVKAEPRLKLVVLNAGAPVDDVSRIYYDISMIERAGGVARLAEKISPERVLFGSNYPLFYFESALLKVREAGWSDGRRDTVLSGNAGRLLPS